MIPNEQLHEHQPRSIFSTWLGVVLVFAFFGLLALVVIGASPRGNNYEEKRAQERAKKLQTAREQTTSALTTYAWVDKTKGIARIPINEAMKLTVAELSQKSPAPANPIAVAEASPAPPSAAPGTASPAPSPAKVSETPKPTSVSGPNSENRSQPAAANNPPPAPPGTQPGASAAPATTPSAAVKAPVSPSAAPSPSAPGTPLPVRGKTP